MPELLANAFVDPLPPVPVIVNVSSPPADMLEPNPVKPHS